MDSTKISNIADALMKVGESLVALSLVISPTQTKATTAPDKPADTAAPKKRAPRVHNPIQISDELAAFISHEPGEPITRPEAEAAVMEYVRANNLQDPNDRRKIHPVDALAALFNSDAPVTVLTLKGAIKHHFLTDMS